MATPSVRYKSMCSCPLKGPQRLVQLTELWKQSFHNFDWSYKTLLVRSHPPTPSPRHLLQPHTHTHTRWRTSLCDSRETAVGCLCVQIPYRQAIWRLFPMRQCTLLINSIHLPDNTLYLRAPHSAWWVRCTSTCCWVCAQRGTMQHSILTVTVIIITRSVNKNINLSLHI